MILFAKGDESGAMKYEKRAVNIARIIMIRPAIAPLFFFKRFHAACCDNVDAILMRVKDTTKLFYPAALPFKTSKYSKPTGNDRIDNMQWLVKWKQG